MNSETRNKTIKTALSLALSLALMLSMMPISNVYAATSADYKAQMEEAKNKVDYYTTQLAQDQTALDEAQAALNTAETTLNEKKGKVETYEYKLNKESREYIDSKIEYAWKHDDRNLNYYTSATSYTQWQSAALLEELTNIVNKSNDNSNLIVQVFKEYKSKYGEDSIDKALTNTMGYYNTLEALDNIDTCNNIRASNSELSKYWVNVMGKPVPNNTPQLKINPYLMVTSAINTTLNGMSVTEHLYGCNSYVHNGSPIGKNGHGQNVAAGKFGDNTRFIDPFRAWWTQENNQGKKSGHNGNIAEPIFNQTGFAISNPNPYSGKAAATQDFIAVEAYANKNVTFTTEEYRTGLIDACSEELQIYESAVWHYENAVTKYNNAVTAFNTAKTKRDKTKSTLNSWKKTYDTAKTNYENALANETGQVTLTWKDGYTNGVIKTQKVNRGANVTPPSAPVHSGYSFIGWDSDAYKNVTASMTITAKYRKNDSTESSANTRINLAKAGYFKKASNFPSGGVPFYGDEVSVITYLKPYYKGNDGREKTLYPYSVRYRNNDRIGTATVTFIAKPNSDYAKMFTSDGITLTFKIIPATPKIKSVVTKKTEAKVTIKSVAGKCSYQYQIRKKGTAKWSGKKSAKTTVTLKKLKKDTKYQLRVRAYKKVGGKTYYGKWKTVTVKTAKNDKKTYRY